MTTLTIPLSPTSSQTITTALSGQPVKLWVRQLSTGLYLDAWLDQKPLVMGAICFTRTPIIRNPASPLPGDFVFLDTQGNEDPDYTGLGDRWVLAYRENDQ